MPETNERFTSIVEEVVGGYYGLPLSPNIAEYYQEVAVEAVKGAPCEELTDCVVRTAVSLELGEMKDSAGVAKRLVNALRTRRERETLLQNPIINA